ncbi:MAG: hypothetical protein WC656_04405 [Sulfurimonas sp.]|jgi:type II secretory pathway component PulM
MSFASFNLNIEYVVAAMALLLVYILFYVFTKDPDSAKNIHSIASVVEELNREVFYLKKNLAELKKEIQPTSTTKKMSDDEIYQEIERSVYDMTQPLSIGIKNLEEALYMLDSQIDARISSLENGVKQFSIPASIHANDDDKIISLFKQGVSLETISKELHLSQPEVEFVLKINKIK